jgi:hypothetical protein
MILNISIPDEVYTAYGEFGYHRPHQAIADQVKRFAQVHPKDARALVVTGKDRDRIEKALGRTVDDVDQMVKQCTDVAALKIGEVSIALPEELQKAYAGQAEFQGRPAGEWLRDEVVRLLRLNVGQ